MKGFLEKLRLHTIYDKNPQKNGGKKLQNHFVPGIPAVSCGRAQRFAKLELEPEGGRELKSSLLDQE